MKNRKRWWASMRAASIRMGSFGAIACGVMVAAAACTHSDNAQAVGGGPVSAVPAESLLVSLDEARRITGVGDLASNPNGADDQPRSPRSEPPGACRVFDAQVAYGSNWTQFRSAVYNGFAYPPMPGISETAPASPDSPGAVVSPPPEPLMVLQTVGIYPDEASARSAFDNLIPALTECSALHAKYYDFTVSQPDRSTIVLNYRINSETIYRVESSTLINISTGGFSENQRVANAVLQVISDRIK